MTSLRTPSERLATGGREPAAPDADMGDARTVPPGRRQGRGQGRGRRRYGRRHRALLYAGRVAVGGLTLLLWQFASGRWVDPFFVSSPSDVAARLAALVRSGELWPHLLTTLAEFGAGLGIGTAGGIALGLAIAFSGLVGQWFHPYVMALYSLPRVALAPLFIVWFGIGLTSKVTMVATMVIFAVFYNVYEGIRSIDPDLLDMARAHRASFLRTLRWIVFPALTPWLLTALRLGVGLALIGAVIAELVGSSAGLGYYIKNSSNLLDITGVFAGLAVITAVAMTFDTLVGALSRYLLRYR